MVFPVLLAAALAAAGSEGRSAPPVPLAARTWLDPAQPLEQRVERLLAAMTLDEQVRLMYGVAPPRTSGPAGYVPGVERLGVPPLVLSDGPLGLRDSARSAVRRPATALPAGVSLAASFDRRLAYRYGDVLGREARARGVHVLYGPAMNLVRHPLGGRNFEYLGEDPLLTAEIAVPYVQGVQRHRVAAQPKHFALNNQEDGRHTLSSNADERTIRELYLPAWQAVLQRGRAWSLMCANNPVNRVYSCEHRQLLHDVVQREWGFDGVVGSDYAATRSAAASVRAGLDQSFSWRDWGAHYRDLPRLVRAGTVAHATVRERARRILRMMFRIGLFDPAPAPAAVDAAAHAALARAAAAQGTVLLRNERRVLPLNPARLRSLAVIGPYAATAHPGGDGSSRVLPTHAVTPLAGLTARAGRAVAVGTDDGSDPARAVALARRSDAVVVVVGDTSREGRDRAGLDLPAGQDDLVARVAAANPRTVVVLNTGAPVTMPWLGRVPAVVQAWYPGQENGHALADVLFGDADPGGRLPVSFPVSAARSPVLGIPRYPAGPAGYEYAEGLRVGYRGHDAGGPAPLFPFGHGLSYSTFRYTGLRVTPVTTAAGTALRVRFTATNTGRRLGITVAQVYLGFPAGAGEPPRQLRAFASLRLAPGQRRTVGFTLAPPALRRWTPGTGWQPVAGRHRVQVGFSAADLPLSATVRLPR